MLTKQIILLKSKIALMKNRLIMIFLFLFFCQLVNSQTVIRMKKLGGVSVIPCKVNGLSLDFIFDTGASDVSLSMTEAIFMLKNGYLSASDIIGSNKYSDANGNIAEGVVVNLKEISISGLIIYNVKASIVKNNKAPLLLGQSAISKLGKIQLDLKENTLMIISDNASSRLSENNQEDIISLSQENVTCKTVYNTAQILPEFPGGVGVWVKYLESNLNNKIALDNGAPVGLYKIVVEFIIHQTGKVINIKTDKDPGFGMKEEVIRVIRNSPIWNPATNSGKSICFQHRQLFTFRVNDEK
jgi:clan AA aspartic protease (TIGR02281 family)